MMTEATVVPTYKLSDAGVMNALQACIAHARSLDAPVTISICDAGGGLLAAYRMQRSFLLSVESSLNKAVTAAAIRQLTGDLDDIISIKLGLATNGRQANGLKGGVPIIIDGQCIGGIGAGSATGDQDREIAMAGLSAIEGAQTEF